MPKFIISGELTISVHTEVTAKDAAAAKRIAIKRGVMSLCHQCSSGEPEEEWVTSGDLDGEPVNLSAEDVSGQE